MFSKSQKEAKAVVHADKVSIIAQGMQINGDIESQGDVRIDGTVHGNIFCKSKVVIIATGKVVGDIQAANADLYGAVKGNVTATQLLSLKSGCIIEGNLTTGKLQIEPNAAFNGHCTMSIETKSASAVTKEGLVLQEN